MRSGVCRWWCCGVRYREVRSFGRSERRLVAPALLVNSKAKGAHFQADRTASLHALPPSCNYSRCRSTSHIPTNRATRHLCAPVCCNNCACRPSQPSTSPQRRPTRPQPSSITCRHSRSIKTYITTQRHGTGTVDSFTAPNKRATTPRRRAPHKAT